MAATRAALSGVRRVRVPLTMASASWGPSSLLATARGGVRLASTLRPPTPPDPSAWPTTRKPQSRWGSFRAGVVAAAAAVSAGGVVVVALQRDAGSDADDAHRGSSDAGSGAVAEGGEALPDATRGVVLYQYDTCPFCHKVKAFLDYAQIPYLVVEVNPLTKKEIKFSKDYRKVPIAHIDGDQVNESDLIIDRLHQRKFGSSTTTDAAVLARAKAAGQLSLASQSETALKEEAEWRHWVEDYFVHLLPPNIYRTPREAMESFDYITEQSNFAAWEALPAKYVGAVAMYLISKRLKRKYGIEKEREELYAAVRKWNAAVGERQFMGGSDPNLADLAMFGTLRSIEFYEAWKDLCENVDMTWYHAVAKRTRSARLNPAKGGVTREATALMRQRDAAAAAVQ